MSKIEVNAIEPQCGTTLTIGASDTSIAGIGTVNWDTTAKTAAFTAVSGRGYFVDTSSAAITVTLPAGSAGAIVAFADYANTFDTNNLTISPNGTDKIAGTNETAKVSTEGASTTFVYVDSTQGWKQVNDATLNIVGESFIVATGGTETTCGDYKIHTFTGPGTFTVCSVGSNPSCNVVDYLVVAGGGGSGANAGGAGAGGFRESSGTATGCYTASPLGACVSALPVTAQGYPITVGSGGAGVVTPSPTPTYGSDGSNSVFSTITSAGGGATSGQHVGGDGNPGGSGGGAASPTGNSGGLGNTPPVSPPQGNDGGDTPAPGGGAGGGGATAAGSDYSTQGGTAPGGAGATTSISGSPTAYSGGGGGGSDTPGASPSSGGAGGGGSGGTRPCTGAVSSGTANTGGGAGGVGESASPGTQSSGGSGIVIIRYKFQ